ncbi:MAG: hypothetical protein H6922_03080 [Pseudomonadaceae bacterium]|nr:hypothetical protein [Pseudomonadaceae bacterium]
MLRGMVWSRENLQHWYESEPGALAAAQVRAALAGLDELAWVGSIKPLVLAVGYAAPFVEVWPNALVEEVDDWSDARLECRYDRIVVGHALEGADDPHALLAKCWQALRPDGVLVVVVPNRLSLWRWYTNTPVADGKGYGKRQLQRLLREAYFTPLSRRFAVACPWGGATGHRMCPHFGGLLVMAACKQVAGMKALMRPAANGKVKAVPVGVGMMERL